jgi:methionyl-tRNA synthetase
MVAKHCEGQVPTPSQFSPEDERLLHDADGLLEAARAAMSTQAIHQMLAGVWQVVGDANRYFAAQEPWALRKSDPARMATVLYVTAEVLRQVAILAQAVMPESSGKLLDLLGVAEGDRSFASLGQGGRLVAGTPLPAPTGVFPRYVDGAEGAA